MYYAAMEIYLITILKREQQAAGIRERESKCSERVAACNNKVQMNRMAKNTQSSY